MVTEPTQADATRPSPAATWKLLRAAPPSAAACPRSSELADASADTGLWSAPGHPAGWLALVLLVFTAAGASCPQMVAQYTQPIPRILPPGPTAAQIVSAIGANTARVHSVHAPRASIDGRGFPSLRANISIERPRRFRLIAETPLTGPEVDLGSNDELFWLWVRRSQPPAIYFCRHDQFATSAARQVFPIEPHWLIAAMGLVELDPLAQHSGPYDAGAGRLRIESRRPDLPGSPLRVTIVDATSGWVIDQQIYDARGQLVARAASFGHRLDPVSQAGLPSRVDIDWPPSGMSLRIDLGEYQVNSAAGGSAERYNLPQLSSVNLINLADPNLQFTGPVQPGLAP